MDIETLISRIAGQELRLSNTEQHAAIAIVRRAYQEFSASHNHSERLGAETLRLLLSGTAYANLPRRNRTRVSRLLRSPHRPWAAELREIMNGAERVSPREQWRTAGGPNRRWLTVARAAEVTGYNQDHIRFILRQHPEIQRRHWHGQLLVRKHDLLVYKSHMKRRGYGPQRKNR